MTLPIEPGPGKLTRFSPQNNEQPGKKKKTKQSKNKQTDKKTVIFKGLKIWLASNFYAAVISPLR